MSSTEEDINTPPITWPPPYTIKRHPLAKYIKLRATRADGLIVSMPLRTSVKHIPKILEEHREWIISHLKKLQITKSTELPTTISLLALNQMWKINYPNSIGKMKIFIRRQLNEFVVTGIVDKNKCLIQLKNHLRELANDFLAREISIISAAVNLPYKAVIIRDQKTLWGSCSADASISLNYKLIFLPYALARHVILHELCHTKHHNHSIRFWQLVATHDPHWRQHKNELKYADQYIPSWLI